MSIIPTDRFGHAPANTLPLYEAPNTKISVLIADLPVSFVNRSKVFSSNYRAIQCSDNRAETKPY